MKLGFDPAILFHALHHVERAAQRWAVTGHDDAAILARAGQEWTDGGLCDKGFMASFKGGQRPVFEIRCRGGTFRLQGRKLAQAIRFALNIPDPGAPLILDIPASADDALGDLLAGL
jgi:hypothetical protein